LLLLFVSNDEYVYVQLELITQQSMRAGFTGGLVVDFPNSTKAKKYVLFCLLHCVSKICPLFNFWISLSKINRF